MKKTLIMMLAALLACTSCEHKELCFHHPHTAKVRVNTDWSRFDRERPTGMTVMAFPAAGGKAYSTVGHNLDYATLNLEAGLYHTLTFNQSPSEFGSVEFRQMDSFRQAEVVAKSVSSRWYKGRAENEVVVTDPEWLASDSDEDNRVTEEMVEEARDALMAGGSQRSLAEHVIASHTPRNMVYTVHVKMHMRGIHNLRSARGAMDGWAQGAKLATQEPLADKATHLLEEWKLTTDPTDVTKGYITATFQCFGFPKGHRELPEDNKLMLSLLLVDNKTQLDRIFKVGDLFEADTDDDHVLYLELDWGDGLDDDPDNPDNPDDPDNPDNPDDPDDPDNPDDPDDPDNPDNPDNPDDPDDPNKPVIPDDPGRLPDVKPEGSTASGFDAVVEDWGEEEEHNIQM